MPFIRGVRTQSERGGEIAKLLRNRPQQAKTRGKRLFFYVGVRETGGQRRQAECVPGLSFSLWWQSRGMEGIQSGGLLMQGRGG